jgi:tagatose 1,6-diphosphate aldolase GatY/KbaY
VIVGFPELLANAKARGIAVGAFTCYDLTTAFGVLRAAEARRTGAILLVSEASFRSPHGQLLVAALSAVAARAATPCCVQLDHTSDPELIRTAIEAGVDAAMADGSRLPQPQNCELVRRVRHIAAARGAAVEAELGHIEGGEDVDRASAAGKLTDPAEAESFVAEAGPDCLAVSIGNVHGTYAETPALDWDRLAGIRERLDGVPISLHGASGLPDDDVRRAIRLGVSKVNFNTEIRSRYLGELERQLSEVRKGSRLLELQEALVEAVAEVVSAKLTLLEASP